ncbi:MAG: hypothetical protein NTX57_10945 [Armatimonadetes bacterium]|nr:hypothetical protein [Armatimonadota bacterium]
MGKQTRADFLVTMGALSLAALTGCAGGAPPDSEFQGTYLSTYTLPGIGENGTFSFSIEQKGKMVGSFTDANTNTVHAFDGIVENTGKFTGALKSATTSSPISGLLVVKGSGSTGGSGTGGGNTGSGGDFTLTRSGVEQRGYFNIGGSLSTVNSEFQGIYSGVYGADTTLLVDGKTLNGLASYSVDSKGNIIGSLTRGAETGLLTGTIGNTGAFSALVKFATATLPLAGTLVKTTDGSAQGNFTFSSGGKLFPAQFSKSSSVVAGGDSPYKGAYRGTYGVPEKGETGNISFTIDPSGSLIGFFNQAANKPVGTFTGSVENDGGFSGEITYNATEVAALPTSAERALYTSRSIQGKIGNRVGGAGVSGDYNVVISGSSYAGNFEASIGGSEVNSSFRAAYTEGSLFNGPSSGQSYAFDVSNVPGGLFTSSGDASVAVDKQGTILSNFGTHRFDGRVTNDGRVVGQLRATSGTWYAVRGIINKVNWTAGTDKIPGLAGNLYVTVGTEEYPIALKLTGGDGGTS